MATIIAVIAALVLLWVFMSKPPKHIWKKGPGWSFEYHVAKRYVLGIVSGCYIGYWIHPPVLDEALAAKWPPLWVLIMILIWLPVVFIAMGRAFKE